MHVVGDNTAKDIGNPLGAPTRSVLLEQEASDSSHACAIAGENERPARGFDLGFMKVCGHIQMVTLLPFARCR